MTDDGEVKLLQLGSVGFGTYESKGFKHITQSKFDELGCAEIHPGYLLINRMIGDKLLACLLPPIKGRVITAVDVCWIAPSERYNVSYLMYLVLSPYFQKVAKDLGAGEGRVRIIKGNLIKMVFPFPPLAEQKRIVAKIKELFAETDKIAAAEDSLACTAERINKKVLDLAIRGQLVPQDPNDEPAEKLLQRIAEARQHNVNVKSRKSKCDESVIFYGADRSAYETRNGKTVCIDDEIPFDIPDSWAWCRLRDLGEFVGGHTPSIADKSNWENGSILWVTSKDMKQKYISDTGNKVSRKGAKELQLLPPGSLLMVTRSGILRRTFPIAIAAKPLTINQDQRALRFHLQGIEEYVYCVLKGMEALILRDYRKTGTTVESIIWEKFIDLLIPIPPLTEQKRIVSKIEYIMSLTELIART